MAIIRAAQNGNWSSTSTWIGGVVPTSTDDVVANNFTIQVDGSYTVLSLRNDTLGGATVGGSFVFSTNNVTFNTTSLAPGATGLISITSSSGTITINVINNISGVAASSFSIILHSGACNFTITSPNLLSNISGNVGNSNVISKTSSGTITINGNLRGGASNGSTSNHGLTSNLGDTIVNGNVYTNTMVNTTAGCYGINQSNGKITVNGDVIGGGFISNTGYAIFTTSSANLEITGNVIGGTIASAINKTAGRIIVTGTITGSNLPAIIGTPSITVIGNVTAGLSQAILITGSGVVDVTGTVTASSTANAIQSTGLVKLSGNAVNTNRFMAVYAPQITIDTTTTSWKFQQFAGGDITLYTPNAVSGAMPTQTDVRDTIVYAFGTMTGSLKVPSPTLVSIGVPTDNTVGSFSPSGTTAAQIWDYLISASTLAGSFGKLIKDYLDAAISSRMATLTYTAPDNSSIASIKAKTDTIVWSDVTAIKERTDKIPNNPASVQSTGDQIASYIT